VTRRLLRLTTIAVAAFAGFLPAAPWGAAEEEKKPPRTILGTRADDAAIGAEAVKGVVAEMGLYEDPKLNAYVERIGRRLLRGVPRRSFKYQFAIVDQSAPNAFALPGGYIFISRGLLALTENEDELACVIGHEITHATKRHAAAQQELMKRSSPLTSPWIRAGNIAAYGRDMERDADRGGQKLAAAAGYDPMGMSTFLRQLNQMERMQLGYSRMPGFLDTHPGSRERATINATRAREMRWKRDPKLADTHDSYLRRIDGLPIGQRPKAGVFIGDRFLHPVMDFQLRFPQGWRKQNTNRVVGAASPKGDAVVFLTATAPTETARAAASEFEKELAQDGGGRVLESQPIKVGAFDAWRFRLDATSGRTPVDAYVTLIPYNNLTFRITGMAPTRSSKAYRGRLINSARTFRPLTAEERAMIRATRVRLVRARPDETLTELSERTGNILPPLPTAVLNALFTNHVFDGGELVKIARADAPESD